MKPSDRALSRRTWLRVASTACLAAGAALRSGAALAEPWPTRTVKIVIALGPGSTGDVLARLLAERLEKMWKQPVIVENRPGASGAIGTEYVARATDGHTILIGTQSSILPKLINKGLKFDPLTDLIPVCKIINYQVVLAANAATADKVKTLRGLVDLSRSTKNGLFFGGAGPTAIFNLTMAVINKEIGIRYTPVDFSNIGALTTAILRDDAQFLLNAPSAFRAQVDSGEIRPLAAINAERYASLPEVPTLREAVGYQGYIPLLWAGVFVPKGAPPDLVEKLHRDFMAVTAAPETKERIESQLAGSLVRSSPGEFARQIAEEVEVWKGVLAGSN